MADFVRNARMRLSSKKTSNNNVTTNDDDDKVEAVALLERKSKDKTKSCVLCVGQTGAGKSATVRRLSRPQGGMCRAESSAGFEPMTKECEAVKPSPPKQGDKRFWPEIDEDSDLYVVDTVGWQEVVEEDEVLFQDLLRFLREEGFDKVDAVLWCVIPNVRRDAALSKQAGFIDKLGRNVWSRTIVVCKQSMRPERDGAGAVKAAEEHSGGTTPKVIGYRYLSDLDNDEQMKKVKGDTEARKAFNVLNDDEVRECLVDALLDLKNKDEVQLEFVDKQCLDCGVVEDSRLMPLHCHMESKREHGERAVEGHPGEEEKYHAMEAVAEHNGKLRRLWYGRMIGRKGRRYTCCGRRAGALGCTAKWACCHKHEYEEGCSNRYTCCKRDVGESGCQRLHPCCKAIEDSTGCKEVCVKCGREWGTAAAECFRRAHNVTDIVTEGDQDTSVVSNEVEEYVLKTMFNLPPVVMMKPY